jgi:hypothetical protein
MRHPRSRHALVLVASVLIGLFAASAAAAKPRKGPCTLCITAGTFPAGLVCPFTVSFQDVVDRKFQIVYPNGFFRILGHRVLEVANEDTGESRTFVLSAMFTFVFDGPRIEAIGHGPSMSFFLPGDLGEGQPGAILYTRGQTDEIDEFPGPRPNALGGTVISFTATGTTENLCQTMA